MNRNRLLLVGIVALALSGIVMYWAYRRMAGGPTNTQLIVVAAKRLAPGTKLTAQDVTTVRWPISINLKGSVQDVKSIEGRGVIVEMLQNDPVLEEKLTQPGGLAGLTVQIPEGMRAVSVKVDNVIGVAGWVLPGTFVDVISTGVPTQNGYVTSKVVVENVRVLSADDSMQMEKGKENEAIAKVSRAVTLLVKPDQAAKIALAQTDGHIQLALRNPSDEGLKDPPPIDKPELYLGPKAAAIVRARETVKNSPGTGTQSPQIAGEGGIRVILGGKETTVKVGGK